MIRLGAVSCLLRIAILGRLAEWITGHPEIGAWVHLSEDLSSLTA